MKLCAVSASESSAATHDPVEPVIELRSKSVHDTRAIAAAVARVARAGDLIVLAGQMGAGKTAFAQGFGAGLGIQEPVTSPTYTLIHTFDTGSVTLHHADLYRLDHTTEVDDLAFAELLDAGGIVLVEWGDVVDLGPHLLIELRTVDDDSEVDARDLAMYCNDPRWSSRLERLATALHEWTDQ